MTDNITEHLFVSFNLYTNIMNSRIVHCLRTR